MSCQNIANSTTTRTTNMSRSMAGLNQKEDPPPPLARCGAALGAFLPLADVDRAVCALRAVWAFRAVRCRFFIGFLLGMSLYRSVTP